MILIQLLIFLNFLKVMLHLNQLLNQNFSIIFFDLIKASFITPTLPALSDAKFLKKIALNFFEVVF